MIHRFYYGGYCGWASRQIRELCLTRLSGICDTHFTSVGLWNGSKKRHLDFFQPCGHLWYRFYSSGYCGWAFRKIGELCLTRLVGICDTYITSVGLWDGSKKYILIFSSVSTIYNKYLWDVWYLIYFFGTMGHAWKIRCAFFPRNFVSWTPRTSRFMAFYFHGFLF